VRDSTLTESYYKSNNKNLRCHGNSKLFHVSVLEFGYLNGKDVLASSSELISKLGRLHMHKYSSSSPPYGGLSNSSSDYDPSMGQSQVVRKYLGEEFRGGFFVECGALDGETRSNTLYLERALDWEGLLIEADPDNFREIKGKGRVKAWTSDSCLSTNYFPQVVSHRLLCYNLKFVSHTGDIRFIVGCHGYRM
jgi:hypothetical protein